MGTSWGNIARDISKAAPLLGNLLPGVGTLAGAAVGGVAAIVASALGVPADPDSVAQALQNDPDAYVKLKTAEMENRVALGQLTLATQQNETAQYVAEANDRDSARRLAAAQPADHTRQIITYLFMSIICLIVIGMFFVPAAQSLLKDNVGSLTAGTIIGYLFGDFKQLMGYWFGATKSNSDTQAAVTSAALSPGTVTIGNPPATQTLTVESDTSGKATSTVSTDDTGNQIYRGS